MRILREGLNKLSNFVNKRPYLRHLTPVVEATDEFFFGTDKTAFLAPYISDSIDIKRYMSLVIVALLPATLAGIYFYGLRVLAIIVVSYATGGVVEVAFAAGRKKQIHEGFLVTGLIFPLVLPPTIPLWMVAVGVVFGVFFGKEVFGGTGRNVFNPALVGRVFLSLAFPEYFATMWQKPFLRGLGGFTHYFASDAVTSATPLINFKGTHVISNYASLLFGTAPGSIGETFRIGVIVGGLFLIVIKIADWRIPLSYLLSVGIFSFFGNIISGKFAPPLFQILAGGLLFGAFFMATDPVTSPLTAGGKWIYGVLLGIFTVLIRGLSGYAEGVMFAILLMNAISPLIDTVVVNRKFKKVPMIDQIG